MRPRSSSTSSSSATSADENPLPAAPHGRASSVSGSAARDRAPRQGRPPPTRPVRERHREAGTPPTRCRRCRSSGPDPSRAVAAGLRARRRGAHHRGPGRGGRRSHRPRSHARAATRRHPRTTRRTADERCWRSALSCRRRDSRSKSVLIRCRSCSTRRQRSTRCCRSGPCHADCIVDTARCPRARTTSTSRPNDAMRPAESRSASTSAPFENTDLPLHPCKPDPYSPARHARAMGSAPRAHGILEGSRPAPEGRYAAHPATPLPDPRVARHRRARGEAVAVRLRPVTGDARRRRRATFVEQVRSGTRDARHHCTAFVLGADGATRAATTTASPRARPAFRCSTSFADAT